jgi:N-acetylmuramoyl-L-alanine amidase-like protein
VTTFRSRPEDVRIHASGWATLPNGVEVTALPVQDVTATLDDGTTDDAEPLFARLTYDDALAVAERHGARLIAQETVHELGRNGLQLVPYLGTPIAETDIVHSRRHDRDVWRQLRARGWNGAVPVAGAGKHWIAGAPAGRSRLMGWDVDGPGPGKTLWQPPMVAHNRMHFDDGTTTVLERDIEEDRPTRPTPLVPPAIPTKLGDRDAGATGPVRDWQRWLAARAAERGDRLLDPGTVDGRHGPKTEAATLRALAIYPELAPARTKLIGDATPDTDPAPPPQMLATLATEVAAYFQARNYHIGRTARVDLVVLHSTENPIRLGVARAVAQMFSGRTAPQASAHLIVGPEETIQGVRLEDTAWAAPGANHNGVQVEQVGQALRTDWLRAGLDETAGMRVLERSARVVAAVCRDLAIPIRRVDAAGLKAGERGITTHAAVTAAFKKSTHVDPGGATDGRWPWSTYLELVRRA